MKVIQIKESDASALSAEEVSFAKNVSFKASITDDKYISILFVITAVEIRFPRFRGTSYLALPTLRDAHRSMQINIEFRPEHYDGVLLYSGEQQTLEGDFIAVIINQGFAEFRFVNLTVKYYSYKLLSKLTFIRQISILNSVLLCITDNQTIVNEKFYFFDAQEMYKFSN
jgi:hypothetical protein